MKVVIVDDSLGECLFIRDTLLELDSSCEIHIINNGNEALECFSSPNTYEDTEKPDLIILDKNLGAELTGLDLLKEIKKQGGSNKITIVMLTLYHELKDEEIAYKYGIDKYYIKPPSYEDYKEVITDMLNLTKTKAVRP